MKTYCITRQSQNPTIFWKSGKNIKYFQLRDLKNYPIIEDFPLTHLSIPHGLANQIIRLKNVAIRNMRRPLSGADATGSAFADDFLFNTSS